MKKQSGFTIIELIIAFVVLVLLAVFFVIQRGEVEATSRDKTRKSAINAMYYNLTEVFYKQNGYYPDTISRDNLIAMDPLLFTDPSGFTLHGNECVAPSSYEGDENSENPCDYNYIASDCDKDAHCQNFKLESKMETEATYIKSSSTK
ncbi:MAG: type II secretion system GspH family protein [Candidatus Nomurabacteria bacterium]|jgi:type II secretory pathway pseudopilin PulG|nr:type II secretion system GspH family protein [Candidatus Nomurabacteria bacterium]